MQIGNVYADLEIPALNLKEFLQPTDCYLMEIVESAGASAPYAVVCIKTTNEKVKNGINENNKIILKIGSSASDADSFEFYPVSIKPNDCEMPGWWTIEFAGFIGSKEYMTDFSSNSYEGTSIEVLKELLKSSDKKLKTSITRVSDNKVTWRKMSNSTSSYAMDVVLHMNLAPSFPICAVDKYSNFILKDFNEVIKEEPKFYLTSRVPQESNEIQFLENFNIESYKISYNIFSGYNKVTSILDSTTGENETNVSNNDPILASTKVSEKVNSGITKDLTEIQTGNTHNTYKAIYKWNTNKLVSLSSITAEVTCFGYYKNLAPLDLVYVKDPSESNSCVDGLYLVDTVDTLLDFSSGNVITKVHITKDNKNNIENYIEQKKRILIRQSFLQSLAKAVSDLRSAYAMCKYIMDGSYLKDLLNFALIAKNNVLRMFSIAGVSLDFTGQTSILRNLIYVGNSLMNTLVDMLFPRDIAQVLENFLIYKPTLKNLVLSYVGEFVPSELRDVITALIDSLTRTTDTLNSIAKDNGIDVTKNPEIGEGAELAISEQTTELSPAEQKVNDIIGEFEKNTSGVDIPFPVVSLTDSQQLMSEEDLKNYMANVTIENLTDLGYLKTEKDAEDIKDVLLGDTELTFNLIDRINTNAGNKFYYRYWGTFGSTKEALYAWSYESHVVYTKVAELTDKKPRLYNDDYSPYANIEFQAVEVDGEYVIKYKGNLAERNTDLDVISNALSELTSFEIKKGYKDKYRTIPCTKIINATENQRFYFACPVSETNLRFYINAKKVDLPYFEVDLGYVDAYGAPIMYNVFYTETGYNSNSVLFEVKKGGMV